MMRLSTLNGQERQMAVALLFALWLIMLLSACGDGSDSSDISIDSSPSESGTASAVLTIQWHDAATIKGAIEPLAEEPLDCEDAGVATITCKVYDESDQLLRTGDAWPCSEHSGEIDGIPVGQNRKFVILGADDEGNIVFQGHKPNVNIEQRPDNDVGTIAAYAFVPRDLTTTTISAVQINLAWTQPNETVAPAGYRIYRDGVLVGTSASTSYSDTGLTQDTEYCYTISAYDAFGNVSSPTAQDCSTTSVSDDEDPPTVPTSVTAQALSASQIDLTWIESSDNFGVTEYRIYRDGNQIGTSASTSFSDTGLIQNTQYCYTVEAYDAAGNSSGQSNQDCATTLESFAWYRDSDNDRYGDPTDSIVSQTQPPGYVSDYTDCNDDAPSIHPGAQEACNSIDDDCDGSVDDGLTRLTSCGVGACADNTGIEICVVGVWVDDTCDPFDGATAEVCDNVDNDCDGSVDEGLTQSTTCGVGACADNTGTATCVAGVWGNDTCDPFDGATSELCDNVDNDCDGSVDEGLTQSTTCGVGACSDNTGSVTCVAGVWGDDTCDPFDGATAEQCDNVDNDCDGSVDEGLTSYSTTCGVGACEGNTGTATCEAGVWNDTCDPYDGATAEVCDEVDNDCDGEVDEGLDCSFPTILSNPDYSLDGINDCADPDGGPPYSSYTLSFDYSDVNGDADAASGASLDASYQFIGGNYYEVDESDALIGIDGYSGSIQIERCIRFEGTTELEVTFSHVDGDGNPSDPLSLIIPRPEGAN